MTEECTRCGNCCKAIPCGIGLALLGDHRPCKALEEVEGRHRCGLVEHTSNYVNLGANTDWKDAFLGKLFSHMLGVGLGCCSSPHTDLVHSEMAEKIRNLRLDT